MISSENKKFASPVSTNETDEPKEFVSLEMIEYSSSDMITRLSPVPSFSDTRVLNRILNVSKKYY